MSADLSDIPVVKTGPDFPFETLLAHPKRAVDLIHGATRLVPRTALRALDAVSRRWLLRCSKLHVREIDRIASQLGRPGAYFLSVNYEWGCTCRVAPSPNGETARLIRVLDWRTPGLGHHVIAVKVEGCAAGPFVSLTWPGFTGVLQGVASDRFCAALNQAPMRRPIGLYALDWAANRARVWGMTHPTPAHLLREVFEKAPDFESAKQMLIKQPIASPAIFLLSGTRGSEMVVVERTESDARIHEGPGVAANHWIAKDLRGKARGIDSAGRARAMEDVPTVMDGSFGWLRKPILNPRTRLVMIGDAASGQVVAQGFESDGRATNVLEITR